MQRIACCGPQYDKPFHLSTDASNTETGAVLFQLGGDVELLDTYQTSKHFQHIEIIHFMSFSLSDSEARYSNPEREMLAVVRGLKECEHLRNSRFPVNVYTDHLSIIQSMNNLSEGGPCGQP
jgi:ribonuclease HI